MKTEGKSTDDWKQDLWKSINEQDMMQLRSKLNNIHVSIENGLQSYSIYSAEDFANFM